MLRSIISSAASARSSPATSPAPAAPRLGGLSPVAVHPVADDPPVPRLMQGSASGADASSGMVSAFVPAAEEGPASRAGDRAAGADPVGVAVRASQCAGAGDDVTTDVDVSCRVEGEVLDKGQRAGPAVGGVAGEDLVDAPRRGARGQVLASGGRPGCRACPCARPVALPLQIRSPVAGSNLMMCATQAPTGLLQLPLTFDAWWRWCAEAAAGPVAATAHAAASTPKRTARRLMRLMSTSPPGGIPA